MSGRTAIYLVRHGSTQWNEEGRWQCMDDRTLSETGSMVRMAVGDEHVGDLLEAVAQGR